MNSSKSSPKHGGKKSFKPVSPFDMYYQLTYMSAMAAAGLSRSKLFEAAAQSKSTAAPYFIAINTLVDEFRYDFPEACRRVGIKATSENMKSFLLRFSDALRSGEPLGDFLGREAEVQGEDYENSYERSLEALKQWTNAFTSIVISVALIVIIQMISSMIYSMNVSTMGGLAFAGVTMAGFGAWIIFRSAPQEVMTIGAPDGSAEQLRVTRMMRLLLPLTLMGALVLLMLSIPSGIILLLIAVLILPIGIFSLISERSRIRKDNEFSTFLRSAGSMTGTSGSTVRQALTRIDLSSFPALEIDIRRLSTRLEALVDPGYCWHRFGQETGSRLVMEITDIFFGAIKIGGDPERVGYLCSLFATRATGLRSRRRMTVGTFAGLATVMQAVVAGLMVFVLSIVNSFAALVKELAPAAKGAGDTAPVMSIGMADFSAGDLQFLGMVTLGMVLMMAVVSATAVVLADGGFRPKIAFYLALGLLVSGVSFMVVPSMVAGILHV